MVRSPEPWVIGQLILWGTMNPWFKALLAGCISGAANGVLTGLGACGIAPSLFNLQGHIGNVFELTGLATLFGALIGIACYLKQSPLPGIKV
jgi:hypothetical protein